MTSTPDLEQSPPSVDSSDRQTSHNAEDFIDYLVSWLLFAEDLPVSTFARSDTGLDNEVTTASQQDTTGREQVEQQPTGLGIALGANQDSKQVTTTQPESNRVYKSSRRPKRNYTTVRTVTQLREIQREMGDYHSPGPLRGRFETIRTVNDLRLLEEGRMSKSKKAGSKKKGWLRRLFR